MVDARAALLDVLTKVGVDGMCIDDIDAEMGDDCTEFVADGSEVVDRLIEEGVVEYVGCSWLRLSRVEWERRLGDELGVQLSCTNSYGPCDIAGMVLAILWPVDAS